MNIWILAEYFVIEIYGSSQRVNHSNSIFVGGRATLNDWSNHSQGCRPFSLQTQPWHNTSPLATSIAG